jgi:hypothetical protein
MSQLEKTGKPTTVYLDPKAWNEYKTLVPLKLNKSASERLRELVNKDLAELKGAEAQRQTPDYSNLKKRLYILVSDLDKLEKTLKQHKVYADLVDLAETHKIDRAKFSNLDKVIAKLFDDWNGAQDDLHLFITLLETVQEKRGVEHELKQIRLERARRLAPKKN